MGHILSNDLPWFESKSKKGAHVHASQHCGEVLTVLLAVDQITKYLMVKWWPTKTFKYAVSFSMHYCRSMNLRVASGYIEHLTYAYTWDEYRVSHGCVVQTKVVMCCTENAKCFRPLGLP